MTNPSSLPNVRIGNLEAVLRRLGRWPSFHDAEVVRVVLDREGVVLELGIKVAVMSSETDAAGCFKVENPALVTLRFADVDELELGDFNQQNAISDLTFEPEGDRTRVEIWPSFGLGGSFVCLGVEVIELLPLESWSRSKKP